MVRGVAQHIGDRAHQLRRGPQKARVVVVGEDVAGPLHHRVERARDADGEALHPAAQCLVRVRLDDKVQVVALHGELDEAQRMAALVRGKGTDDAPEAASAAQVPDVAPDPQGDVNRRRLLEALAGEMRNPPLALRQRLAPGALPASAPGGGAQFELAR